MGLAAKTGYFLIYSNSTKFCVLTGTVTQTRMTKNSPRLPQRKQKNPIFRRWIESFIQTKHSESPRHNFQRLRKVSSIMTFVQFLKALLQIRRRFLHRIHGIRAAEISSYPSGSERNDQYVIGFQVSGESFRELVEGGFAEAIGHGSETDSTDGGASGV